MSHDCQITVMTATHCCLSLSHPVGVTVMAWATPMDLDWGYMPHPWRAVMMPIIGLWGAVGGHVGSGMTPMAIDIDPAPMAPKMAGPNMVTHPILVMS